MGLILMTQNQHRVLSKPFVLPGDRSWFPRPTHSPVLSKREFHRFSSLLKPHFQLLALHPILLRKCEHNSRASVDAARSLSNVCIRILIFSCCKAPSVTAPLLSQANPHPCPGCLPLPPCKDLAFAIALSLASSISLSLLAYSDKMCKRAVKSPIFNKQMNTPLLLHIAF